jgi:hypothetical protein
MRRPGIQRAAWSRACLAQSVSFLCVLPLLVRPAALPCEPLRGRQHGQERQRPDAARPRYRRQQGQRHPAQAAGLDEMAVAGAHGVTVDAARRYALAPAPLQRVVHADDHGTARREDGDQQPEQHLRRGAGRPARPVQHAVVAGEAGRSVPPRRAQGGADCAPVQGEQGALDQHRHPAPGRRGEQAGERRQPRREQSGGRGRGRKHGGTLRGGSHGPRHVAFAPLGPPHLPKRRKAELRNRDKLGPRLGPVSP